MTQSKIDIICRGKLSWIAEEILEDKDLEFFDDTMDEYKNTKESLNQNIFISIGDTKTRKSLYEFYLDRNHISVISPNSVVSKRSKISPGSYINHFSCIHAHVDLGLACFVHTNSTIDVGVSVGDFCRFGNNVHVGEYAKIGNETVVGSGVVIIPRISIGNNCTITAGSVVTHSFGDNEIIAGIPARSIKHNV
jgi:UDP-3-O-[3-hydroxymyristoyl] glucosamine N-acyltransferase